MIQTISIPLPSLGYLSGHTQQAIEFYINLTVCVHTVRCAMQLCFVQCIEFSVNKVKLLNWRTTDTGNWYCY